jgi:hypothetical protein
VSYASAFIKECSLCKSLFSYTLKEWGRFCFVGKVTGQV